jgi:nucleoside-diphosphate-sugar epimerase
MRVFITGASGWIGSAVVPEFIGAGHEVLGLARSDSSAATIAAAGGEALRGDLHDLDAVRAGSATSDAVVHLAFIHDFTQFEASVQADARAIEAMGAALEGSDKPLVIASGTPALAAGRVATEHDEQPPGGPVAGRAANAQAVLAMAERGVRASVVRLPRSVHGEGDHHGLIASLIDIARDKGFPATSATVQAAGRRCTYWTRRTCSASPRSGPLRVRYCTRSATKAWQSARSPR